MEILIENNQKGDCPLSLSKMREVVLLSLKKSRLPIKNKQIILSIAFVTPLQIKKINRIYRKKDKVTDILSFGEYSGTKELQKEKKAPLFLGELMMCCADIKKSAKINKISFKKEFVYVFSHGVLHLLGFDHEEKMFVIQDRVVENLK